MIKYKRVLCDVLKCSEYKESGARSSCSINNDVAFDSFDGCIYYDGDTIEKGIPFIKLIKPFPELYIPENKFNFITSFLIGLHSKIHRGITIDNKKFYISSPHKIGDVYVQVSEE